MRARDQDRHVDPCPPAPFRRYSRAAPLAAPAAKESARRLSCLVNSTRRQRLGLCRSARRTSRCCDQRRNSATNGGTVTSLPVPTGGNYTREYHEAAWRSWKEFDSNRRRDRGAPRAESELTLMVARAASCRHVSTAATPVLEIRRARPRRVSRVDRSGDLSLPHYRRRTPTAEREKGVQKSIAAIRG